jgi:hypothetical protein
VTGTQETGRDRQDISSVSHDPEVDRDLVAAKWPHQNPKRSLIATTAAWNFPSSAIIQQVRPAACAPCGSTTGGSGRSPCGSTVVRLRSPWPSHRRLWAVLRAVNTGHDHLEPVAQSSRPGVDRLCARPGIGWSWGNLSRMVAPSIGTPARRRSEGGRFSLCALPFFRFLGPRLG